MKTVAQLAKRFPREEGITHAETVGLEGRASYYDGHDGATRDMIQSHLLQVLVQLAMESPVSLEAESLRDEKVKVLRSIRPVDITQLASHAVRAQYAGYHQEAGISPGSHTETCAAAGRLAGLKQ